MEITSKAIISHTLNYFDPYIEGQEVVEEANKRIKDYSKP